MSNQSNYSLRGFIVFIGVVPAVSLALRSAFIPGSRPPFFIFFWARGCAPGANRGVRLPCGVPRGSLAAAVGLSAFGRQLPGGLAPPVRLVSWSLSFVPFFLHSCIIFSGFFIKNYRCLSAFFRTFGVEKVRTLKPVYHEVL